MIQRLVLALALAFVTAGPALAQQPAAPTPAPPAAPAPGAPAATTPPPYESPHRQMCAEEIEKDAGWKADISKNFLREAHRTAAESIQRNERHVFLAYGAIWILVAGLVGFMWYRQARLAREIRRLEEELRKLEDEDKK